MIPLLDLTPIMCRWPTAYRDEHLFCGHAKAGEHTPYCADHHAEAISEERMEKVRKREDQYLRYMAGADRLSKAA